MPKPLFTGRARCDNESTSIDDQKGRVSGCSPAPSFVSSKASHTKLPQSAAASSAACHPGQASAPGNTTCDNTAPVTDVAPPHERQATHHNCGGQRDPQLSAASCGTTSSRDGSTCLPDDEWDRRSPRPSSYSYSALQRLHQRLLARLANPSASNATARDQTQSDLDPDHRPQGPHTAASSQKEGTRPRSDGRYRPTSHDHHGDKSQTSGPAYRRPPVPDGTGERTEDGDTEHDRGNVIQRLRKRGRISTSTLEACEPAPKRQAISRSRQAQESTAQREMPRRSQRSVLKPPSSGVSVGRPPSRGRGISSRVASTGDKVQRIRFYQVEKILGVRLVEIRGQIQLKYWVKWEGYKHKDNTWEPVEHLENCPQLLQQFHERERSLRASSSRKQERAGDGNPGEDRPVRSPATQASP